MKKLRFLPLLAFALAVGICSFTTVPAKPQKVATILYWYTNPSLASSYQGANTTLDEQSDSGCDSIHAICEQGFTSSQLVDPSDPTKGVLSSQQGNGNPIRQR